MIIVNAKIHLMSDRLDMADIIDMGYIKIQNRLIKEIGEHISSYDKINEEIIDVKGLDVYPGFIDAHNHLGIIEDSLSLEGDDVNEMFDPITPQLRVIDAINPNDICFKEALMAGVTTVVVNPGSTNPIAGDICAIKTFGQRIDNMILKSPIGIKFSMGENPKKAYNNINSFPSTRMSVASLIRETLMKAKNYRHNKEYNMKYESLQPLLNRESIAFFHAHRSDDIFTSIRIAKEFNLKYVIIHGTDGHIIADELKQEEAKVLSGPFIMGRTKPELKNLTSLSPVIMNEQDIPIAIISDHPEFPCQYLPLCAHVANQEGMSRYDAIRSITINPAKICGIDKMVGSIEVGKYANLVAFDGNPLISKPKLVIGEGTLYKYNSDTSSD